MSVERIVSGPGIPPPGAPYSPATIAGGLCFVSGQVALDPATNRLCSGSAREEARIAMTNAIAILDAAGLGPADVAQVTVLLDDIEEFAAVNEVYAEFFPPDKLPARMAYEVAALPLGAKVEVQMIASASS